ncbi:hypothetical protein ES708_31588 [subsurface metagenome]
MHRYLLPFYLHSVLSGTMTNLLSGTLGPLRQYIPQTFPPSNHLHHCHHCLSVSELKLYPSGILLGQDSPFETFHSKGDSIASGDSVQTVGTTYLVAFSYSL